MNRRGLIWGLKQPVYSAIAIELWVLTKFWYTYGYIKHGPKGVRTSQTITTPVSSLIFVSSLREWLASGRTRSLLWFCWEVEVGPRINSSSIRFERVRLGCVLLTFGSNLCGDLAGEAP